MKPSHIFQQRVQSNLCVTWCLTWKWMASQQLHVQAWRQEVKNIKNSQPKVQYVFPIAAPIQTVWEQ